MVQLRLSPPPSPEQQYHSRCPVAFRQDIQAEEVIFILEQLLEQCNEWGPGNPLSTFAGDAPKARDYADRGEVALAGMERGAPKVLLARWLGQVGEMSATVSSGGIASSADVCKICPLLQGGAAAPYLSDLRLDIPIGAFIRRCEI
eukprot:9503023-Pyramimonas_sp.AAC.1